MKAGFFKQLCEIAGKENVRTDEPMKQHTTFRIGGAADYFVSPQTTDQIKNIIDLCKSEAMPWYVIGNGSNLLVSDRGFRGVIIQLFKNFSDLRVEGDRLYVQAGTLLSRTAKKALEASLTGFEFAAGIPGTIGGAMVMNAGAYGGEMKDVLYKCEHIDKNGDIGFLEYDDLKLSYRHSAYYDNGAVITGLYLKLKKGEKSEIKEKMDDLIGRRRAKQPLEYPSAGSTFKRPEGYFAGALIEQCNLKGKSVGGAQVSEKHAGFVINKGGATCKDVLDLCKYCSDKVMEETGVKLEMEIRVTK